MKKTETGFGTSRSYYGRPVIKQPVWKPEIPWYFFAGGLGGVSTALAFAAGIARNRPLGLRSWWIALAALAACPVLLIRDLGRPERFLNMLRVFKPTSPMSVGAWLLPVTVAGTGVATANETFGLFPRIAPFARALAAIGGPPLATYTGALLANSAVPVWHDGRRELPFVFGGSAVASAGAAAVMVTPSGHAAPARRMTVAGAVIETLANEAMRQRLGDLAVVYQEGASGRYARTSKILTVAGASMVGIGGRRRTLGMAGGALVLAGSVLQRWSVFRAGFQSAADPTHTIAPQRRRAAQSST